MLSALAILLLAPRPALALRGELREMPADRNATLLGAPARDTTRQRGRRLRGGQRPACQAVPHQGFRVPKPPAPHTSQLLFPQRALLLLIL